MLRFGFNCARNKIHTVPGNLLFISVVYQNCVSKLKELKIVAFIHLLPYSTVNKI